MSWRVATLIVLLLAPLFVLLVAFPPIAQDPHYHALADGRAFFGIPNFWNVVSNLAFLAVGLAGLTHLATRRTPGATASWFVAFLGLLLVAPGSAYYHWDPRDGTLVWDRLPMTLAFMGVFVALVCEHVDEALERTLLAPAIVVGVGSVLWWQYSGDLRLYAWVQLAPLLAAGWVLLAFRGRYGHRIYLLHALLLYAAAKVAELHDAAFYGLARETLSGHTVKHLLAALAGWSLYRMVSRRAPRA